MAALTFASTGGSSSAGADASGPVITSRYSRDVEHKPYGELVRIAQGAPGAKANAANAKLADLPNFICKGNIPIDDSGTDTVAAEIVDLVDQGVVFAADTIRRIRLRLTMFDDDNLYVEETEQYVYSAPDGAEQLIGSQKLVRAAGCIDNGSGKTNQPFGFVTMSGTVGATGTVVEDVEDGTAGLTLTTDLQSDFTDALVLPACRKCEVLGTWVQPAAGTLDIDGGYWLSLDPTPASGTGIPGGVVKGVATDDGDIAAAMQAGRCTVAMQIWPPAHAVVAITSGQPSVNVSLPDLSLGDRMTRWLVEVWVDDPINVPTA